MNAIIATPAMPVANSGRLDLERVEAILVKFYFTNRNQVPQGIPYEQQPPKSERDALHAANAIAAGRADLAQVGRHREGRVDTGVPVIKDLPMVQAELLRSGLAKAGYALTGMRYWQQSAKKPGDKPKWVVQFQYTRDVKPAPYPPTVAGTIEDLVRGARWQSCYVWQNPDDVATINFVGRQPDGKAKNFLVCMETSIVAVPA